MCRVRPYYLYQCDLINGSSHLRTRCKGIEIIESLRGHTTGYAVPQYVIDAPAAAAKCRSIPATFCSRQREIVIRNYEGQIFEYPETGGEKRRSSRPQREYHDEYLYS